jgi:hypothetical protein
VRIDPSICENRFVLELLSGKFGVEQRLIEGRAPLPGIYPNLATADYMIEMTARINRYLQPPAREISAEGDRRQVVEREQVRAIRYYLTRAGITAAGDTQSRALGQRRHLLDLHALAGYQAYGKFIPDGKTNLLLDQLRRHLLQPTLSYRSRESTVDGTTRRGRITQVLKWQLALDKPEIIYERFFNHKMLYLRRVSRKSQDLYTTLLVVLDIGAAAHEFAFHGGRVHSLEREVAAHLIQDCYQVLYQVPKLYTDAFIIVCAEERVLWYTVVELSDGSGKQKDEIKDVFLQPRRDWLSDESATADPTTFFHFLLPMFESAQCDANQLEEWLARTIRETRATRASWIKASSHAHEWLGGMMPVADLMITLYLRPSSATSTRIPLWHEGLYPLALSHQLWIGECDDHTVTLGQHDASSAEQAVCALRAFQEQQTHSVEQSSSNRQSSMRQQFIQKNLQALIALCSQVEMA